MALTSARQTQLNAGLAALPVGLRALSTDGGRNGEALVTDEAEVWKRVLSYRIAKWLGPRRILETHVGRGVGTKTYLAGCGLGTQAIGFTRWERDMPGVRGQFSLIDVDPFGLPYQALAAITRRKLLTPQGVLCVTNGEAMMVARNLQRTLYAPTTNVGRLLPRWVTDEYLPRLEALTGLPVRFFYVFPTSVRAICSKRLLPSHITAGCPQFMHWTAPDADAELALL